MDRLTAPPPKVSKELFSPQIDSVCNSQVMDVLLDRLRPDAGIAN